VAAGEVTIDEEESGDRGERVDHFLATTEEWTKDESGCVAVAKGGEWRVPSHAGCGIGEGAGHKSLFFQ
jgi:hypothetical protein